MKVLLGKDLVSQHRSNVNLGYALNNPEWEKILKAVQGTWVEIDTTILFSQQYNSKPIEGVSEDGIRVMGDMIASERKHHPRLAPKQVIDYEGDNDLQTVQEALNGPGGANWCHHVRFNDRRIVDARNVPEEVLALGFTE